MENSLEAIISSLYYYNTVINIAHIHDKKQQICNIRDNFSILFRRSYSLSLYSSLSAC